MNATEARAGETDGDRSVLLLRLLWLPLLYLVTGFLHTYPLVALFCSHPTPLRLTLTLADIALFVGVYVWATWHNALSWEGTRTRAHGPSWLHAPGSRSPC